MMPLASAIAGLKPITGRRARRMAVASAGARAAFALGTVPVLAAIGVAGGAGGRGFQGFVARAAPVALLFNALILATAALNSFGVR